MTQPQQQALIDNVESALDKARPIRWSPLKMRRCFSNT